MLDNKPLHTFKTLPKSLLYILDSTRIQFYKLGLVCL